MKDLTLYKTADGKIIKHRNFDIIGQLKIEVNFDLYVVLIWNWSKLLFWLQNGHFYENDEIDESIF